MASRPSSRKSTAASIAAADEAPATPVRSTRRSSSRSRATTVTTTSTPVVVLKKVPPSSSTRKRSSKRAYEEEEEEEEEESELELSESEAEQTLTQTRSPRGVAQSTVAPAAAQAQSISAVPLVPESSDNNVLPSFIRRTWTSLLMLAVFFAVIYAGHPALVALVFSVQVLMFREIVHIAYSALLKDDDKKIPLFRTQNWFWFFITVFYVYGRLARTVLHIDIPYHNFISFALVQVAFVTFVLSLRPKMYRTQFSMFAYVLLAIVVVVLQSTSIIFNMFEGIFWFVMPALLIISNDTWAYIWGILFGRTPLIALSPRKTLEGFLGAFVCTLLTAFFASKWLAGFPLMICAQDRLTFQHPVCQPSPIFIPQTYELPFTIPLLGWNSLEIAPVQIHCLYLGLFASLIAPFGGFFASGFKRAFKIKDFGTLIPGHGGLTDRMDCQLLMGVFVYVYYWSFVVPRDSAAAITVDSLAEAAMHLNSTARSELIRRLTESLAKLQ